MVVLRRITSVVRYVSHKMPSFIARSVFAKFFVRGSHTTNRKSCSLNGHSKDASSTNNGRRRSPTRETQNPEAQTRAVSTELDHTQFFLPLGRMQRHISRDVSDWTSLAPLPHDGRRNTSHVEARGGMQHTLLVRTLFFSPLRLRRKETVSRRG